MIKYLFLFATAFLSLSLYSQSDSLRNNALKIYIDCNYCDIKYIKENIQFVNYVRDIKESDVYVLSSVQMTGSGGEELSLFLNGQNKFKNINDTIKLSYSPDNTEDDKRKILVEKLKLGLVRYVLKTPLSDKFSLVFNSESENEEVIDKWNNWVFSSNIGGYFNGEKLYKNNNLWGSININKVTEKNKFNLSFHRNQSQNIFVFPDTTYKSGTVSNNIWSTYVIAINDHWSYGGTYSYSSSTYRNYKFSTSLKPAIEYNIFPYSESTVRLCRIFYNIGYGYHIYNDTTIYNKLEEGLFRQNLSITYQIIKKWGSITLVADASNYMHDFSKYNIGTYTRLSFRIFKGFSVYLNGGIDFVRDQIYLPKEGATSEEMLLRQRQLESQYQYWGNFGINYTFGSIYNNVVNPRFGD